MNTSEDKRGIYVVVSVKCSTNPPFERNSNFWLPQEVQKAAIAIREKVHVNRVFDIPDELCKKSVVFYIKAKPAPGLKLILKGLEEAGVEFQIINEYKEAEK